MNYTQALATFGITNMLEAKELKALYRKLARANHPDHGGSTKAMQAVNEAYEVLVKCNVINSTRMTWAERKAQAEEEKQMVTEALNMVLAGVDTDALADHAEATFGKKGSISVKHDAHSSHATTILNWISEDKQTVVCLDITLFLNDLRKVLNSLGGSDNALDLNLLVKVVISHDGRDIKLTRSRWLKDKSSALLFDFNELLPAKKLQNAIKKANERAPKRQDSISFLAYNCGFKHFSDDTYGLREGHLQIQATRAVWFKGGAVSLTLFKNRKYEKSITLFTEEEHIFTEDLRRLAVQFKDAPADTWYDLMITIEKHNLNTSEQHKAA